jgi:hypothetical protein
MAGPAVPSIWRAVLDPALPPPAAWRSDPPLEAVRRFAALVGAPLAADLLAPLAAALGRPLVDAAAVRDGLLLNRLAGRSQRAAVARLADASVPVVCLKGFALAHTLYADPDLRTVGDLDLLVARADLDRTIACLETAGFAFAALPTPAWGFISEASFMPMVSADGVCSVDLHVEPDCYPAYRALTAARVFAGARDAMAGEVPIRVPAPAHALLLALTNAAKDKFGPISVRKLVDAALLARVATAADWEEVRSLARAGGFLGPARTALALLVRLGMPPAPVPDDFRAPPRGLRAPVFAGLVRDHAALFPAPVPATCVLAREVALCTEPRVALSNAGRRLRGLVRPRSGVPAGHEPGQ